MKARLIIPGQLPGLNDYIEAERAHRQRGARLKREAQGLVLLAIRRQLREVRFTRPVHMRYLWVERSRRRDKDNVSAFGRKVIQDALVAAKVLQNDGWAHVEGFTDAFDVDKKKPRIEVEISDEV